MAKGSIIVIDKDLLRSAAFRSLSAGAIVVYMDFCMRCHVNRKKDMHGTKIKTILNNGELVYTYAEAEKKTPRISRQRFMKAIDQLVEKGPIDIAHSGNAGRKGDVNLYAISERWRKYGTNEFEHKERPRDLRGGRGFAEYWKRKKLQSSVLKTHTESGFQYPKANTERKASRVSVSKIGY